MRQPFALLLLLPLLTNAVEPLSRDEVPDPLRTWIPWVLKTADSEAISCAFLHQSGERRCAWPARVVLTLDEKGGRFSQQWRIQREEWVSLPGDDKHWPLDVKVDGTASIVTASSLLPRVHLKKGDHVVSGTFAWDSVPESLRIPSETGIVELSVRGKSVSMPNRDASGLLYLSKQATPEQEENLEVSVERKITDEVPLLVTTRIVLNVSGKAREVLLGRALPQGLAPLVLDSPLPARLEGDQRLRIQVRPGEWTLTLVARAPKPIAALTRPKADGIWASGEEIWVFEPRPQVRLVDVEGISSIDPQQTRLPDDWKRFAAYPLNEGDSLQLVERRRGDADPAPDQLSLSREMWLDFDGKGFAIKDHLSGRLNRSTRLTMAPGTQLGRVEIAGRDQFITQLADKTVGVEVRDVALQVVADSRIDGHPRDIPAVSWNHDFQAVSATLHLPPGWRLFHSTGADDVPGTWVKQWTLLDLFLLLLTAIAAGRLFGPLWGGVVLLTLTLSLQENDAPQWLWLAVLAGEALVRALPEGRIRSLFRAYRFAAAVGLALACIAFVTQDIRHGMYPALERSSESLSFADSVEQVGTFGKAAAPPPQAVVESPPPASEPVPEQDAAQAMNNLPQERGLLGGASNHSWAQRTVEPAKPKAAYKGYGVVAGQVKANRLNVQDVDRSVAVQTGMGLPQWSWDSVAIRWSGPVDRSQRLHLYFLSPLANLLLAIARLLAITLLFARLLPVASTGLTRWLGAAPRTLGWLAALATGALLLTPAPARAELPSSETLQQLQQRLVVPPPCQLDCVTSGRMSLEATSDALALRLEIDAAAITAFPLPGHVDQWTPDTVVVDGKPAAGLYRSPEGVLWLPIEAGAHVVQLKGALPRWDSVQVALPLKPHWMQAKLAGWTLAGLHEDGQADSDLQLTRVRASAPNPEGAPLQSATLPPFVHVRRVLSLALDWEVNTEVVRASPFGSAVVLEVPLLTGESVTSPDVRVVAGKALVNLSAQQSSVSWHSTLPRVEALKLIAPENAAWVEEWKLDVSPLWHVALSGIPPIHRQEIAGEQVPEFRPWPGESVSVEVSRPQGIPGQTLTVDQTHLQLRPGLRATDATFRLSLRSSRGGQHTLLLPEGAELQSVSLNGVEQQIRQEGRKVTLPLAPHPQLAVLTWREPRGMGVLFRTSSLDIGTPSVNAHTEVEVPASRWILFAGGPRLGPSVLFWSTLVILVVVSLGLSRSSLTPLKGYEWLLLSLGLSQVPLVAAATVAGWLLFLGWRGKDTPLNPLVFNLRQLFLAGWTLVALGVLVAAIREGLLGQPDMQIAGNSSSEAALRWFADRTGPNLSKAWVLSVPVLTYRLAMLAWALWLARALLRWLRWGWTSFNGGGLWKGSTRAVPPRPPTPPVAPPASPPA